MMISDKVLELLDKHIFGENNLAGESMFMANRESYTQHYRIGLLNMPEHNGEIFGDSNGKMIKDGCFVYEPRYEQYCKDLADNIIKDIELYFFDTPEMRKHKDIITCLQHIYKKMCIVDLLNEDMKEKRPKFYNDYMLRFYVGGWPGNEAVRCRYEQSPGCLLYGLENMEFVDELKVTTSEDDEYYDKKEIEDFFDKIEENEDLITISQIFSTQGINSRREILRNSNGDYDVIFKSWEIWKNKDNCWLETIGKVVNGSSYMASTVNLVVSGSENMLNTMVGLVKGGN